MVNVAATPPDSLVQSGEPSAGAKPKQHWAHADTRGRDNRDAADCDRSSLALSVSSLTLVCIRHRARPWEVGFRQFSDLKSCGREEVVNLSVEMAPACEAPPKRCEAVLPSAHIMIWSAAMLDKDQPALWS